MQTKSMLALAAALAIRAGEAILAVRDAGFEVIVKADRSPVTAADRAAEAIIVAGLRAAYPDIPVIAEEESAEHGAGAAAELFWLVDPLDGTREFTAGTDDFTVNIGLVQRGRPILGVVSAPALGEMFTGIVGEGAWKRTASGETFIRVRSIAQQAIRRPPDRRAFPADDTVPILHQRPGLCAADTLVQSPHRTTFLPQ